MAQASKGNLAKELILKSIGPSPSGIRYNKLFEQVSGEVRSRATFERYLTELEQVDHSIKRIPDPDDPRAKRIVQIPESSRRKLILLQSVRKIEQVVSSHPRRYRSWEQFELAFQDWRKNPPTKVPRGASRTEEEMRLEFLHEVWSQREPIFELVRIAHSAFIEMEKSSIKEMYPHSKSPLDIYLRVTQERDSTGKPLRALEILHRDEVVRLRRGQGDLHRQR
jgi:hypothetical protein